MGRGDRLWGQNKFSELFGRDRTAFWSQIKRDWYNMDFFAPDVFEERQQFITAFYRDEAADVKVRETYLFPEELDRFVISAVEEILRQCSD